MSDDRLWSEVTRCKHLVADELGAAPVSFAYPYGHSSRRVRRAVRGAGFRQSLAVNNALAGRCQGPYALTRLTVRRDTATEEFARLVEGRAVGRYFARERALTKGYAVVRRARQAAKAVGKVHGSRV